MRFDCDLPASTSSLRELRARFARWLAEVTNDRGVRAELVLALSELAIVALNEAEIDPSGARTGHRLVATAWTDETGVVMDLRTHRSVASPWQDPAGDLAVVASLTDALRIRDENGWRHVGAHASVSR
jgi:hypothetical protein